MKMHRILLAIVAGAALLLGTAAQAKSREIGPEEFREALINWALESEQTYRTGEGLADKIAAFSDQQIEAWISLIEDPDTFAGICLSFLQKQNPDLAAK